MGYRFLKQPDKNYPDTEGPDVKYVWNLKGSENQPAQEPEATAQEPQNLSENLIKNIVSKHLRSRL